MRGMAIRPVNPLQATSVVGLGAAPEDEFLVTHIRNRNGKTSGGRDATDYRENTSGQA